MNKVLILIIAVLFLPFQVQSQKLEKCKFSKESNVPKYKIGHWERNETDKSKGLLIFIGLKNSKIDEAGLISLAKHLEKVFCKENRASFWIFNDYRYAKYMPFDDTGSVREEGKRASIAGYNFDRSKNENNLLYNLNGFYNFGNTEKTKINLGEMRANNLR